MDYPFVYVASLMRTGSTLIQELLTEVPYSFIFHEPQLCRNKFNIKEIFLTDIKKYGIDISSMMKARGLSFFAEYVVPLLEKHILQIGVKEIENGSWERYLEYFPNTKIILVGRDPRDIYISIYYWFKRKRTNLWKDGRKLSPQVLLEGLAKDFNRQKEMFKTGKAFKLKYEDLCENPNTISEVKKFIKSPLPGIGNIGGFLSNNPKRMNEYDVHGNKMTLKRIERWKEESDKELLEDVFRFFNLMSEYCNFWRYEK